MSGVQEFEYAQSGWAPARPSKTRPYQAPDGSVKQVSQGRCGGWSVVITVKFSPRGGETGRAHQGGALGTYTLRAELCV